MRAQGSVTAQRPHRLAQPLRRVTPSRPRCRGGECAAQDLMPMATAVLARWNAAIVPATLAHG